MCGARAKPPNDRQGHVHTAVLGQIEIEFTVNVHEGRVLEVFGKCTDGYQGEVDSLCIPTSIALQYGAPLQVIASKLRHRNYPPHGTAGQAKSISDALAIVLEQYLEKEDE